MEKSHFTDQQISAFSKKAEPARKPQILAASTASAPLPFTRGRLGGMEVSDIAKMRTLDDENRPLKRLLAESALEIDASKLIASGDF